MNAKTKSKAIVIFPYNGYENNPKCEWYFWWTIERCKGIDSKPIVVVCSDTAIRNQAESFINDPRYKTLDVVRTWSVDTCQTWLSGWGHVLDNYPDAERVILLPGDIDYVHEDVGFYDNLKDFIESTRFDILIGDFNLGDQNNAKGLVDQYGTWPLLANWFPEISRSVLDLPLSRARSEFLNIKASVLRELLIKNRRFAYEQTLNFLIKSWSYSRSNWKHKISAFSLGKLSDNKSFRHYRGCVDQIERIERMLSLLWREIREPKKKRESEKVYEEQYSVFSDKYDQLCDSSKKIMKKARVKLRSLLGV